MISRVHSKIARNCRTRFKNKPGGLNITLIHCLKRMHKKQNYSAARAQNLKVAREEKARKRRQSNEPNSEENDETSSDDENVSVQGASSVTAKYDGSVERVPY